MLQIVIATRNPHKARELAALMRLAGIRWRSLADFPDLPAIAERGRSFRANAIAKARAAARLTGLPALADDSGLEVDALGGQPGARSARFAGRHGDDQANTEKLLGLLRAVPAPLRTARFRCALALAGPARLLAVTEGAWEGRIAASPRGRRGFGYDPVFLLPALRKTAAELPPAVKNRLSHRGQTARLMREAIARLRAGRRLGERRALSVASRAGRPRRRSPGRGAGPGRT